MGSLASEATVAADMLRDQGTRAGVLGIRVYRPFPAEDLRQALSGARLAVVFDKNVSYGYEGATCSDLKAALYSSNSGPTVHNYIVGIGGRDVKARELAEVAQKSLRWIQSGRLEKGAEWLNCQI
jgi:pyruvate/2-oxoacid:ferredoxin oxidoreductase alpha subunit